MIGKFTLEHLLTVFVMLGMRGIFHELTASAPEMPSAILYASMAVGFVISLVFWGAVYGVMIYFLTRPYMVAAYDVKVTG